MPHLNNPYQDAPDARIDLLVRVKAMGTIQTGVFWKPLIHAYDLVAVGGRLAFRALLASSQSLLDPRYWIQWGGVPGIAVIIFIETGLFFGFFFPGDSLLIVAGLLASEGLIDLRWLIPSAALAAILGDQVGYTIGLRLGGALEVRYVRFQKNIRRAQDFYQRHGGKTITIARFVPVIRTFAPPVAGAARMNYRRFVTYNILGGAGWVSITTLLGYALGKSIPNIDNYLLLVIAIVVLLSLIPAFVEYARLRRRE